MKGFRVLVTPWRSSDELLRVRECLYPEHFKPAVDIFSHTDVERSGKSDVIWQGQKRACDQISAWKLRPPLPHPIESTWLLTEAVLTDHQIAFSNPLHPNMCTFSIKASYATALTRFVTALLDSSQTSKYKVSMYTKAAELGLPAMFVDLRHEATHGELPSLSVLRDATKKALEWLWDDYWRKLEEQGREYDMKGERYAEDTAERVAEEEATGADDGAIGLEQVDVEPWGVVKSPWRPVPFGMI